MPDYSFPFYSAINDRIFPRSYAAKFLLVAFVSTHIPLIAVALAAILAPASISLTTALILLLLATLIGTLMAFYCFSQLLKPVRALRLALRRFLQRDELPQFPSGFGDEMGLILRDTQFVLRELQRRAEELSQSASHDHLTGLFNRRGAERALSELLSHYRSSEICRGLVIGIADIDHFKAINDRHGHPKGDEALRLVANFLRKHMRAGDWVARWGGEEFLIVMQNSLEGASQAMERLRRDLAQEKLMIGGECVALKLSIGLVNADGDTSLASLIAAADRLLYEAKQAGRNRVVCACRPEVTLGAQTN